ncbi:hypothetical protein [Bacillus toyonensis]|nr:hypothetical protein [Bacillus toyonensis]
MELIHERIYPEQYDLEGAIKLFLTVSLMIGVHWIIIKLKEIAM